MADLNRTPGWMRNGLGMTSQPPAALDDGPILPVMDVMQSGLGVAEPVYVEGNINITTTPTFYGLLIPPGDMQSQYLITAFALQVISLPFADSILLITLLRPGSPISQGIFHARYTFLTATKTAYGNSLYGAGLMDFPNAFRWIPPGMGFQIQAATGFGASDNIAFRMQALKIPAGFDIAPRGA